MARTTSIVALIAALCGCGDSGLFGAIGAIGGPAGGQLDCPVGEWQATANSEAPIGAPGFSAYELGRPVYGDWHGVVPGAYEATGDPLALNVVIMVDPWADVTAFTAVHTEDPDIDRCVVRIDYDFTTAQADAVDLRLSADVQYEVTCALEECGAVADAVLTYPINAETRAPAGALGPTAVAVVHRFQGQITEAEGAFWVRHREGERTWEEHLVDWVARR